MTNQYKGLQFIVHRNTNLGSYCAYVRLPDDFKNKEVLGKTDTIFGMPFSVGYEEIDIECHGGLTFGAVITEYNLGKYQHRFSLGCWIGWDYSHAGDYIELMSQYSTLCEGKRWTEEEITEECKNVIEQLLTYNDKPND